MASAVEVRQLEVRRELTDLRSNGKGALRDRSRWLQNEDVPDARTAVKAGDIYADIAQQPSLMGRIGVETAQRIINKQSVPATRTVPVQVLTKENA